MMRFSELELKEKEGCVPSAAPGPGRERERERELAESQRGAGDWEQSQPSSRPSAALSALSDHTEQHNGKACTHTQAILLALSPSPALPFIFFLFAGYLCLTLSVFLVTSVVHAVSNFCLACRLPFFMDFTHPLSFCPIS